MAHVPQKWVPVLRNNDMRQTNSVLIPGDIMPFDLILKGGRVIDPSQNIDRVADVGIFRRQGRQSGNDLTDATEVRDVSGYIVSPA